MAHGIAISQIEELNTTKPEVQVDVVGAGSIPLSSNIDRTLPVVMATDNNDLLEDTQTGANTTHCTTRSSFNENYLMSQWS